MRQTDAAVRSGIAGYRPAMQCDAVPVEPLHIRHGLIVIFFGIMFLLLLKDGEAADRRVVPRLSGGDGGRADQRAAAIDIGHLLRDADDNFDWSAAGAFRMPDELA